MAWGWAGADARALTCGGECGGGGGGGDRCGAVAAAAVAGADAAATAAAAAGGCGDEAGGGGGGEGWRWSTGSIREVALAVGGGRGDDQGMRSAGTVVRRSVKNGRAVRGNSKIQKFKTKKNVKKRHAGRTAALAQQRRAGDRRCFFI